MGTKLSELSAEELKNKADSEKTKKDEAQAALDKATAAYAPIKSAWDKYQARVKNTEALSELVSPLTNDNSWALKPLAAGVANLKSSAMALRALAEDALDKVHTAKAQSDTLEAHIAEQAKAKTPVSADLATDSPAANTSISKAWDDASAAYASTIGIVEVVAGLEQSLIAINTQLREVSASNAGNLAVISSNFKTLGPTKKEEETAKKVKTDAEAALKEATDALQAVQDEQATRDAKKAILDAING
ncbi:MAG: hypothetical protein AAF466_07960 [Bacteroidota bacterium]